MPQQIQNHLIYLADFVGEGISFPMSYFLIASKMLSSYYSKSDNSAFNLSSLAMHSRIYLSFLCFFSCLFSVTFALLREDQSTCLFIFYSVSITSSSILSNYLYIIYNRKMSSALELEKKLEILLDEINDIFHATSINIEALGVQMSHKNTPKELSGILGTCNTNLNELKKLLQERSTLRLNYLITEQIKQEQAKVRRQRLSQYEQKILDQRRLISDKQSFYENLLRPKKKRPPNMSVEEFQDARRKQISEEENRKFQMLKNEVTKLDQFYQLIKKENDKIEGSLQKQQEVQEQMKKRTDISEQIKNSQLLYNSLSQSLGSTQKSNALKQLFNSIKQIKIENESLMKQYLEEKQMEQYLRWEKKKLVDQYLATKQEIVKCRQSKKNPKPVFQRPVSR